MEAIWRNSSDRGPKEIVGAQGDGVVEQEREERLRERGSESGVGM